MCMLFDMQEEVAQKNVAREISELRRRVVYSYVVPALVGLSMLVLVVVYWISIRGKPSH